MCNFASFVLTKDRVFWSENSDSHSTIIAENNLHEWGSRGPNILKVEIRPSAKIKKWPSPKAWDYIIDQDMMPEWHIPATSEKRARAALSRRFKAGFKTVDASGCTALTSIDAPEAKTMYANGCTALTSIDAPEAKTMYASGCTALTSIDAPEAKTMYASGCTALTSIDAPEAEYVDASGCNSKLTIKTKKGCYIYR